MKTIIGESLQRYTTANDLSKHIQATYTFPNNVSSCSIWHFTIKSYNGEASIAAF